MIKKVVDPSVPVVVFDAEVDEALGYRTLRPVDGQSMDQKLWSIADRLGLKRGDRVTFKVKKA